MLQQDAKRIRVTMPPPLDVQRNALFLDLDGTLVDFAAHPEQVVASQDLRMLLQQLSKAMSGAVAIITGRTIASADAVLDGALVHIAGVHGFEWRSVDRVERTNADLTSVAAALADARAMIAAGTLNANVEDKAGAIALHYRNAPEFADAVRRSAGELARRHGLNILEGKMVIELRLGGRTKADAVVDFMRTGPFLGRTPIAIGDDVTDEDAFVAVAALGGHSILVGEPRPTAAQWRLENTDAVHAWLSAGAAP